MMINYLIVGAGMLSLTIAGFLANIGTGFLVLGLSLVLFGLVFDKERI